MFPMGFLSSLEGCKGRVCKPRAKRLKKVEEKDAQGTVFVLPVAS